MINFIRNLLTLNARTTKLATAMGESVGALRTRVEELERQLETMARRERFTNNPAVKTDITPLVTKVRKPRAPKGPKS